MKVNRTNIAQTGVGILALVLVAGAHAGEAGAVNVTAAPNFTEHVAPIIYNNCSSCHRPGEAAPFTLLNYSDVKKRGRLIARVTESRFMPPWHAESADYTFLDERRLTDAQIATLKNWVASGMPQGDPAKEPALPNFTDGWQLGEPDLVVKMTAAYTVPADGPDIYRNFVVPLNLKEDKWVQAIEFRPGNRSVVHHSLFYYDTSGTARKMDGQDGKPGFQRMGRGLERGGLGGWAVGGMPRKMPDGLAYRLPVGSDLILSTHFHPSGKVEREVSTVGFYFADKAPKKSFTAVQLPPAFGALAGVAIPPGDSHYVKKESIVLPVDTRAFGVSAHAHYLGKSMKMEATLPSGKKKDLLTIKEWDFSWQEQYAYKNYIDLPAGTRIDAEVVWDNSTGNINNPHDPPQLVRWGRESTDEMGSVTLQIVAVDEREMGQLKSVIRNHARQSARQSIQERVANSAPQGGFLQRIVKRFDKNGDGRLSGAERQAAVEEAQKTPEGRKLLEQLKNRSR